MKRDTVVYYQLEDKDFFLRQALLFCRELVKIAHDGYEHIANVETLDPKRITHICDGTFNPAHYIRALEALTQAQRYFEERFQDLGREPQSQPENILADVVRLQAVYLADTITALKEAVYGENVS
jgi:hypothetical protein